MLFQIAHHSRSGVESERAATRQDDRMDLLHGVDRVEQVGLARARSGAANINSADRALFAQDHRAAGRAARIGKMADFDSGDIGDRAAFILGDRICAYGRVPLFGKRERGRGETASQNVTSRCFPRKSSGAEAFAQKLVAWGGSRLHHKSTKQNTENTKQMVRRDRKPEEYL